MEVPPSQIRGVIAGDHRADSTQGQRQSHLVHFDKVQHANQDFEMAHLGEFIRRYLGSEVDSTQAQDDLEMVSYETQQLVMGYVKSVTYREHPEFEVNSLAGYRNYITTVISHINKEVIPTNSQIPFKVFTDDIGDNSRSHIDTYISKNWRRGRTIGINNRADEAPRTISLTRSGGENYQSVDQETGELLQLTPEMRDVTAKSISESLFSRGDYWTLLGFAMNWNSCGRGGECGIVTYDRMGWDDNFQCVTATWFQAKTLISTPTTWVPDASIPELCVFTSLGICWAMRDGINRCVTRNQRDDPVERRIQMRVFPRGMSARQMTDGMRKGIPSEISKHFNITCVRKGSASHLANEHRITYDESVARGGWATGSNRDSYVVWFLRTLMPSVMTLAGYSNPKMKPVIPTHGSLTPVRLCQMDNYMKVLFPNQLPEFDEHGRLFPLMRVVFSTLIMNFGHFVSSYGKDCPLVQIMIQRLANRDHHIIPAHEDPLAVLLEVSHTISKDFRSKVQEAESAAAIDPQLHAAFTSVRKQMKAQQEASQLAVKSLQSKIDILTSTMQTLMVQLQSHQTASSSIPATITGVVSETTSIETAQPSPTVTEHSASQLPPPLTNSENMGNGQRTINSFFKVPRTAEGSLVRKQQTLSAMANAAQPSAKISCPFMVASLRGDDTLRQILEKEYQRKTFLQEKPLLTIKNNNRIRGDGASDQTKYRLALHIAFLLLTPEQQRKLVTEEEWEFGERDAAFRNVDVRYVKMHAMLTGSKQLSPRVCPKWQGVANFCNEKERRFKLGAFDVFSYPDGLNTGHMPCLSETVEEYDSVHQLRYPPTKSRKGRAKRPRTFV